MQVDVDQGIIVGAESWLNASITSGEIFPVHFDICAMDMDTDPQGGVFLQLQTHTSHLRGKT